MRAAGTTTIRIAAVVASPTVALGAVPPADAVVATYAPAVTFIIVLDEERSGSRTREKTNKTSLKL